MAQLASLPSQQVVVVAVAVRRREPLVMLPAQIAMAVAVAAQAMVPAAPVAPALSSSRTPKHRRLH